MPLQELGCNVMYQLRLNHNPQIDLQGALRIFRTGQTQQKVYLYRVMVDCYSEKTVLQAQVPKAGGWRQRLYNIDNACEILDIPESWREDEPEHVDGDASTPEAEEGNIAEVAAQ